MTTSRRKARQSAFQALFEADQTGHDPEASLSSSLDDARLKGELRGFAQILLSGVLNNKERIDEIIVGAAPAWPIAQMAVTDRVALEIGIYEVCFGRDAPVEVAINEAVELAKTFGGENSGSLVNGVLRTVAERQPADART